MTELRGVQPLSMKGNVVQSWKLWIQKFKNYLIASETNKKSQEIQCAQLLHFLGEDAIQVYNTFKFTEKETNNLDALIKKFENHFVPKRNLVYERYKFFTYKQTDESIEQYATELKNKAKNCEFKLLEEDLTKTMLIIGIKNDRLREKLLESADSKLEKVIEQCIIADLTKQQTTEMKTGTPTTAEIGALFRQPTARTAQQQWRASTSKAGVQQCDHYNTAGKQSANKKSSVKVYQKQSNYKIVNCTKCGNSHDINKCPAFNVQCHKCKKLNHFANKCRFRDRQISNVNIQEDDAENLSIDAINNECNKNLWYVNLTIAGKIIKFKLDSGADESVISLSEINKTNINLNNMKKTNSRLSSYSGENLPVIGKINTNVEHNNKIFNLDLNIIKGNFEPILGRDDCVKLNLIKRIRIINNENVTDNNVANNPNNALIKEYKNVFEGIGNIGKPYHINIEETAKPVVNPVRKVPFALQNKLKQTLDELEKLNIIKKVEGSSDWVNPIVIVKKSDDSLRICLDPQDLNKAIKREIFKIPTLDEVMSDLNGAQIFSTLDATHGFWNIPLDEDSSKLCTFSTPFGRFRFLRMPFGIKTASEVFQERFKNIFNIQGVQVYIDDILVWGKDQNEHDIRLKKVFELAKENNIKFNLKKCRFSVNEIKYLGYIFSREGIKIDEEKIEAIRDMPSPKNKLDIQRFLGMVTYVSRFIKNLSEKTQPLRDLIKNNNMFFWGEAQENAFKNLKADLIKDVTLNYFDLEEEVTISVDASKSGLGAVLLQKNKPCAYASRAMTETQKRYAQIEKELLAICFGINKFSQYVYGKKFTVETDHKPLLAIFKKKLNDCPARLQRMMLSIQKYEINLVYKPGKDLVIADTLSRANLEQPYNDNLDLESHICLIKNNVKISDKKLQELIKHTEQDEECKLLKQYITEGWPNNTKTIPENLRWYKKFSHDLTIMNQLIYKSHKIIIPKPMRKEILNNVHKGHLGINKCINRANYSIYWPGMNRDIENIVSKCKTCQKFSKSNRKEPLICHEIPKSPWQKVGIDLFEIDNKQNLLVIDYYSKYVEIENLGSNTTAENVIKKLKSIFARHGIPNIINSDNGPQFTSKEFQNFSKEWNFNHTTSSPYHQQSNGLAERAIQTVKGIIKKCSNDNEDIHLALLIYRNTPVMNSKYSPSELLMSRHLRDNLPLTKAQLKPKVINYNAYNNQLKNLNEQSKKYYDRKTKIPITFKINEKILYQAKPQSYWSEGKIVDKIGIRKYLIEREDGTSIARNSQFIKKMKECVKMPHSEQRNVNEQNITVSEDAQPSQIINNNQNNTYYSRRGRRIKKTKKLNL